MVKPGRWTPAISTLTLCTIALSFPACEKDDATTSIVDADGRILIQDRTGKRWDITYAVQELGFTPENFNFGLGPDAIRPIIEPEFLAPGDPGYPHPGSLFLVLGISTEDEARAYRIRVLTSHEVVDETIGDLALAVTY